MFPTPQQPSAQDPVPQSNPLSPLRTPKRRRRGGQPGNQNARKYAILPKAEIINVETPKKKTGGQPGNQNARTHGFYARRLPQSQLDGLEETTVRSLEDEIGVMRVFSQIGRASCRERV